MQTDCHCNSMVYSALVTKTSCPATKLRCPKVHPCSEVHDIKMYKLTQVYINFFSQASLGWKALGWTAKGKLAQVSHFCWGPIELPVWGQTISVSTVAKSTLKFLKAISKATPID